MQKCYGHLPQRNTGASLEKCSFLIAQSPGVCYLERQGDVIGRLIMRITRLGYGL